MARGESAKPRKRASGITIFSCFGLVCLVAAFVLALTGDVCTGCTGLFGGFGGVPAVAEPFPGAATAISSMSHRDCVTTVGPTVGTMTPSDAVAAQLDGRGYVPATNEASAPRSMPFTLASEDVQGGEGGCGILTFEPEEGAAVRTINGQTPCDPMRPMVAWCAGDSPRVDGLGMTRHRLYLLPGVTRTTVERTGLSADEFLSHAEAEHLLRKSGYTPTDEWIEAPLPSGTASSSGAVSSPTQTTRGCTLWVVVSEDAGNVSTSSPAGSHWDSNPHAFAVVTLSCHDGTSTETHISIPPRSSEEGGRVTFRAYNRPGGPLVPTTETQDPVLSIGSLRSVESGEMTTPTPIPID